MGKTDDRVTCQKCGMKYQAGAPHSAFCHGRVKDGDKCVCCGQDDKSFLYECRECGDVICECCKEDGSHGCLT